MPNAPDITALSDYSLLNIINAAVNGIIVLDINLNIIVWNDWLSDTSGIDTNNALGKNFFQLFPEQQNKRLHVAAQNSLKNGSSTLLSQALNRFPLPLKNIHTGEAIQQMIYVNPINTENNSRYCLIQVNDVTAAVKREHLLRDAINEAQQAKEQAESLSNLKSGFVSTVSHELRTPLTSILGSLGLINSGALGQIPDKVEQLVDIAHKNSNRLLLLINDILDIEKIESGQMVFNDKDIVVTELLQQAIEANEGYAKKHHIEFVIPDSNSNLVISGDFERLMQVMNNLMSNAAKFAPENSQVLLQYEQVEDLVKISVTDKGPGIPEDFQATIFEKFTQADMSDAKQKGGTGLGLNISKAIIEKHGGNIDYVTQPNKGTTFYFTLPAKN